jgi:phospholipid/cholesterol/gamma-HCH transport system substrate-binding protein
MKRAIKNHMRDFIALIVLFLIAIGVSAFILGHERLYLPSWVPGIGTKFYHVNAEFSTAQAVVPGQGQTVDIAGVPVGEIGGVDLKHGVAVVKLNIREKYKPIYRNAHMLLRPKTGLKDMIVEMDPGDPSAGALPDGGTIPVQNTAPDVNVDEILSSLDQDTRSYLAILLQSGGEALSGPGTPAQLRATLLRIYPTNKDLAKITGLLSLRRKNLAHVVHNFSLLTTEVGKRDTQLAELVGSANANFRALANQDANIQETLSLLPDTLTTARNTLVKADAFAKQLGPTSQALIPTAEALGPSLQQVQPFLRTTTPVIQKQLRPFAVDVQPTVVQLRIAAKYLKPLTPQLTSTFTFVNKLLNTLAYNPPGAEEGYLFWVSWANHAAATVFGTQDAQGAIRRGSIVTTCDSLNLLAQVGSINPALSVLLQLLNPPDAATQCAQPGAAAKKKGQEARGKGQVAAKAPKQHGLPSSPTPPKPVISRSAPLGGGG